MNINSEKVSLAIRDRQGCSHRWNPPKLGWRGGVEKLLITDEGLIRKKPLIAQREKLQSMRHASETMAIATTGMWKQWQLYHIWKCGAYYQAEKEKTLLSSFGNLSKELQGSKSHTTRTQGWKKCYLPFLSISTPLSKVEAKFNYSKPWLPNLFTCLGLTEWGRTALGHI